MRGAVARLRALIDVAGDGLLALVVMLYGVTSLASAADPTGFAREPDPLSYVLAVVMAAPLVFRRRWPLPVLGVLLVGLVIFAGRGYPDVNVDFFGPIIALYTIASLKPLRVTFLASVATATAVGIAFLIEPNLTITAGDWLTVVAFLFGTSFVGDSVRRRRAYAAALEARTIELEAARHELALRAVTEERLRMARELHDVVAHTMTAIVVQSAVARRSLASSPTQAASSLETIETISREGLNELRSILAVLRSEGENALQLAPTARLVDLDALADRLRASGMDLTIHRNGDLDDLAPLVELACFRIVQEALTNALRYASGASVDVFLQGDTARVKLEIIDTGAVPAGRVEGFAGTGKGIAGMEERAALLGGTFEAGPRPGGGFRVAASLPRAGVA